MHFTLILLLVSQTESLCDTEIIDKIHSIWGKNKVEGVLEQLLGTMTYLFIPDMLVPGLKPLRCIKTVLLSENDEAEDHHLYEQADPGLMLYQMYASEGNVTRSFTPDYPELDDYVFPIYLKHGVFGFWQCREDYQSFINIGVINYFLRQEEAEVKDAIAEAKIELRKLGMDFPETKGRC